MVETGEHASKAHDMAKEALMKVSKLEGVVESFTTSIQLISKEIRGIRKDQKDADVMIHGRVSAIYRIVAIGAVAFILQILLILGGVLFRG